MTKPNFEAIALEWLVRATGFAAPGQEKSLAVELEKMWDAGSKAKFLEIEWSARGGRCPACCCEKPDGAFGGHAADCELDALRGP